MPADFTWHLPTEIFFGPDALSRLKKMPSGLGGRVFLVTGANFARKTGLLDEVTFLLGESEVEFYHYPGAEENPDTDCVDRGAEICRARGCDLVLAVGGGSALDAAKAIALTAVNPGPVARFFNPEATGKPALPVVAVPTTAGTGSEVTRYAVLVDRREKTKKTVTRTDIIPRLALVQPSLCLSMPGRLTAVTGLDAMSHAIEGCLSVKAGGPAPALAARAAALIRAALPVATSNPGDIRAREKVCLASLLAGMVINQTGTVIGHGLGYPLTLNYGIAHGLANALVLPAVLDFLGSRGFAAKIRRVTGWAKPAESLRKFCGDLGLPVTLGAAGVKKMQLPALAVEAEIACRRALANLGLELDRGDFLDIYRAAHA